jgi:polysaccharide export outer membrane protein
MLRIWMFVAAATLAACAPNALPPDTAAVTPTSAAGQSYVIGPGDSLSVFVYRAPELSLDVPVRPDGRISIPLVPDIQAAGRTPTDLARDLERRLREYVVEPNVTVIVRSFVGPPNRMIRVIGEVAEPQAIPYRDGMTILDVMIATRGLTRFAAGNRAELVRRETPNSPQRIIPVRLNDLVRGGDIAQDMPVQPGDTLIIPQSWF